MLGYDVTYLSNPTDEELMKIGSREARTLLTSDVQLYRRAAGKGLNVYLLNTSDSQAVRLAKLAKRFGIKLDMDLNECRCPKCNSLLQQTDKTQVAERVPPTSLNLYSEFWICTNKKCGKVYWRGSHWKKISELLNEASHILSNMVK